jgi:uncharacterized membrane protein
MPDSITKSITVKADVEDMYNLWANFENFPRFMEYIKSVTKTGDKMSHWVMQGPLGAPIEWDAETTRLEPNTRIAWNSKDNSTVKTSGQVIFTELGPIQTEIAVTLHYEPPAGVVGDIVAQLFSNPARRLEKDLERFKAYVEDTPNRIRNARASAKLGTRETTDDTRIDGKGGLVKS